MLAVPDPTSVDLDRVKDLADSVIAWSATCEDLSALADARARVAAIETYCQHRSHDAAADLARADRLLEVRIGELIEKRPPGPPASSSSANDDLPFSRQQAHQFRKMAEHKEEPEVAAAIEEGRSRSEVLRRIDAAIKNNPPGGDPHKERTAARVTKARKMAAEGYTSRQIAETIGIDPGGMGEFKKRHGIEVPADAALGRPRHIDADRVVREAASTLEGVAMGLDLISPAAVDPDAIPALAESMKKSLQQITRFYRAMKDQQGEQK